MMSQRASLAWGSRAFLTRMPGNLHDRACAHPSTHREESFEFEIQDENDTQCSAIFYMGEEGSQKQIGDEQTYILNLLKTGKPVFKGLIVPGGKVDMLMTA